MSHPLTVQPSISCSNIYQAKGIGIGYNVATIIYDCAGIPNYDPEVKVKMQGNQVWMNEAN
jgi:hypothetical protein